MGLYVRDRISLTIRFNGTELPLEMNTIDYLHIVESRRLLLPQLTFQFTDATKFLTRKNLTGDGTLIEIILEVQKVRKVFKFRLFTCVDWIDGGSTHYRITGYWAAPLYWAQTLTKTYSGSTSAVLTKLATECGLTVDAVATNDSQAWIPMNKTYGKFAQDIAEHGYVNDQSCMVMGITSQGVLKYRNLAEFNTFEVKGTYYSGIVSPSQDPITDFKVLGKAGFSNSTGGYKSTLKEVSTVSTTATQDYDKLSVVKNSQKLSMNDNIRGKITQGKVEFAPINAGNVHDKYNRAVYQNKRGTSLFGFGLAVLTPKPVLAELFDCVVCSISKPGLDTVSQYSGKYLISSRVIYLQGINYFEKMELVRHGTNDKADRSQV